MGAPDRNQRDAQDEARRLRRMRALGRGKV